MDAATNNPKVFSEVLKEYSPSYLARIRGRRQDNSTRDKQLLIERAKALEIEASRLGMMLCVIEVEELTYE